MEKTRASSNALKGYNFQGSIYSYFICLMDLKREIVEIDAEVDVDNNFDDIFVKTSSNNYFFQVKNYYKIDFDKIIFKENSIIVNGKSINVGNKGNGKNILLIKDLVIPKVENSGMLFGLKYYEIYGYFVVGYSEEEISKYLDKMYKNNIRFLEIERIAKSRLNSGEYKVLLEDLPQLSLFTQKLQEETLLIRNFSLNDKNKKICIVGSPGVGKSHLVNELVENNNDNNYIIERLWISEEDKDKCDRLKFEFFLRDIGYKLFKKAEIVSEDEIIKELEIQDKTLIIDGLDHVENYNNKDMDKFINFINRIYNSKLIIMTRPLKTKILIDIDTIELNNWNFYESNSYLRYLGIKNYQVWCDIFNICKGYPIITYYLAQHYLSNNNLPKINEVKSISNFYDELIGDKILELSSFLINDSYFKISEFKQLCTIRNYEIIESAISKYKYLFKIKHERIYFMHDSLNFYLRSKKLNYLEVNNDIIEKIMESLNRDEFKYLTRIRYLHIPNQFKINIVKKVCKFSYLKKLLLKTLDYEAIQMIYNQIEYIISTNKDSFDIYEYYEFILIKECLNRNHHMGFYSLILERIKYYIKNNLISFENIYSNGLLYNIYTSYVEKNKKELEEYFNYEIGESIQEMDSFYYEYYKNEKYFNIFSEEVDIKNFIKENIIDDNIFEKQENLIKILSYLYVNNIKYKDYEKIPNDVIQNNVDEAYKKCSILFKEFKIRENFINSFLDKLKDYIFSLGEDLGGNYYKNKTLKELIIEKSKLGSFNTSNYICNYIRLANFENRKIDIESLYLFYFMYYNRKDYSMHELPRAMKIFSEKQFISKVKAVNIISNAMDMSEKGIRTIMTDFYNMISLDDFKKLNKKVDILKNNKVSIEDLKVEKINTLDKNIVFKYFYNYINKYTYNYEVNYDRLGNLLRSKYSNNILRFLNYYNYKIDGVTIKEFDIHKYDKENKIILPINKRKYVDENDLEEVIKEKIPSIELAKYLDGWYNALPYANLFECYFSKDLGENFIDIVYNACFSNKKYGLYPSRFAMVGSYLEILQMSNINVEWKRIFKMFNEFLEISLVI